MQYILKLGWILLGIFLTQQAFALTIGMGWHPQGEDPQAVAVLLKNGGFRHLRFDISSANYHAPTAQSITLAQKMQANGVAMTGIIHTKISVNVSQGYCPGDIPTLEAQGYSDAYAQANGLKDYIQLFELENEVNLYPNVRNGGKSPFTNPALYNTACGNSMAAVLRGMSRAVRDVANTSGKQLRIILGATSDGSTGFLTFMQQKGVAFDIVGFHVYPRVNQNLLTTDPWFGPNGAVGLLAGFGKPIHINEFNCGETYDNGFTNVAGSSSMNACVQSIDKQLSALSNSSANIEVIDMFQLIDQRSTSICATGNPFSGSSADAECRFGMRYDMANPKPTWDVASKYAQRANAAANGGVTNIPATIPVTPVKSTTTPIVSVVTPTPTPTTSPTSQTGSDNSSINAPTLSLTDYVWDIYRVLLGREPSSTEANGWIADINGGKVSRLQMQKTILVSTEFLTRQSNNDFSLAPTIMQLSKADFITLLYKLLLQRAPEAAGFTAWVQNSSSRDNTLRAFLVSGEYARIFSKVLPVTSITNPVVPAAGNAQATADTQSSNGDNSSINEATLSDDDYVWDVYRLLLGREPVLSEANNWIAQLSSNSITRMQMQKSIQASVEFTNRVGGNQYGIPVSISQLSKSDFITLLYKALFQRAPEASGLAFWVANNSARENVLRAFLTSAEYRRLYQ